MDAKFLVEVRDSPKPLKVDPAAASVLKGAASGKMISRLKKEYVHCPVIVADAPFLECFACVSFIRRVKGVVHCAGIEKRLRE